MKTLLDFRPLFDPVNKTLDFSLLSDFSITKLFAVINVTQNTPIYIPGASGYGISSVNGSILTLSYDTSSHSASDVLNVYYTAENDNNDSMKTITAVLGAILTEIQVQNIILLEHIHRNSFTRNDLSELRYEINNPDVISNE
jgi:hypothetical protein